MGGLIKFVEMVRCDVKEESVGMVEKKGIVA